MIFLAIRGSAENLFSVPRAHTTECEGRSTQFFSIPNGIGGACLSSLNNKRNRLGKMSAVWTKFSAELFPGCPALPTRKGPRNLKAKVAHLIIGAVAGNLGCHRTRPIEPEQRFSRIQIVNSPRLGRAASVPAGLVREAPAILRQYL